MQNNALLASSSGETPKVGDYILIKWIIDASPFIVAALITRKRNHKEMFIYSKTMNAIILFSEGNEWCQDTLIVNEHYTMKE